MTRAQLSPVDEGTRWPSGEGIDLAYLPLSEADLAARIGLPLVRGTEDFRGPWAGIAGVLPSGEFIEFVYFFNNRPPPAVILRADKGARYSTALDEALQLLGMSRADAIWLSPILKTSCQV